MTRFVVTGADLHAAAAWAARILPARPVMPILGGILLEAHDDLRVSGYDLDTAGTATIPATVTEPGRILVSAQLLAGISKTVARDVDVVITADHARAEMRCGRAEWGLPLLSVEDYPQLPVPAEPVASVEAVQLRRALARVLPFVHRGDEAALANIAAVKFEAAGDQLTLIATNRYKLAAATIPLKTGDRPMPELLAPADLLLSAARSTDQGMVDISVGETTFALASDEQTLVGRQVADPFPPWQRLVPPPGDPRVVVDRAELDRVVEQVQVAQVATPQGADTDAVKLTIEPDAAITVSATIADTRARAEVDAHTMTAAAPWAGKMKPGYLREALAATGADTVSLHLHKRMVLVLPCNTDGEIQPGVTTLVMLTRGAEQG